MAFIKGQSGNPAGKKPGTRSKLNLVAAEFLKEGSAIARTVIEAAKAGDMSAASLVLQRLSPPLRAAAEKVVFDLDQTLPLTEQAKQIMTAVSQGCIDPDTGAMLIACLDRVGNLKAVEELEARLAALENKP
jgi:ribosomal protein S20